MTENKDHAVIRIPPPILTIIHITMAILLGALAPLPIPLPPLIQWVGLIFAALGFIIGVLAFVEFKRARASVNPKGSTKSIVTTGIYGYTRNPIYLGFVFMLIGLPLNMGTYWGIILVWPLVTFMNNMTIKHEEAYLEKKFGEAYTSYKSRVRRWL
jgi:protein-S-isoprenylcysteine O-methyltransferase Ste14